MEQLTGTEDRSANCGEKAEENEVEALQLGEEIQRAVMAAAPETGGSFTALLELPANQAMELLHSPGTDEVPGGLDGEVWSKYPAAGTCGLSCLESLHITPMFPSNTALLERASMFSVFAAVAENSPGTSSIPSNSTANSDKVKQEPADSDSNPNSFDPTATNNNKKSTKRKQREKKGKESTKKSKSVANETLEEGEKLPYVHVRARRGQATDSHSLAERARREKINARMKLLQELVPGCNKISGTAMVLEEIINHVQCLQRQVEILSMRLATVNPSIDFDLDSLLATEGAFPVDSNFPSVVMPLRWPEGQVNGIIQQYQHLWHFDGLSQPVWGREDNPNYITLENSLLSYNPSMNSASLQANQVKMEL